MRGPQPTRGAGGGSGTGRGGPLGRGRGQRCPGPSGGLACVGNTPCCGPGAPVPLTGRRLWSLHLQMRLGGLGWGRPGGDPGLRAEPARSPALCPRASLCQVPPPCPAHKPAAPGVQDPRASSVLGPPSVALRGPPAPPSLLRGSPPHLPQLATPSSAAGDSMLCVPLAPDLEGISPVCGPVGLPR